MTVVHCLGEGNCKWRYDERDHDWQCMYCGIWEKTAERVLVPQVKP